MVPCSQTIGNRRPPMSQLSCPRPMPGKGLAMWRRRSGFGFPGCIRKGSLERLVLPRHPVLYLFLGVYISCFFWLSSPLKVKGCRRFEEGQSQSQKKQQVAFRTWPLEVGATGCSSITPVGQLHVGNVETSQSRLMGCLQMQDTHTGPVPFGSQRNLKRV